MKWFSPWRGRVPRSRSEVDYRPQVVGLEDRLPPGETLLGLALSAAWWDGPGEAMRNPVLSRPERHPALGSAGTLPAFADPPSNAGASTVAPPAFPEALPVSHDQAGLSVSTTAGSEPFSVAGLFLTPTARRAPNPSVAAGGALATVGSAPVVSPAGAGALANGFVAPGANPLKAPGPSQTPALAAEPASAAPAGTDLSSANRTQIQEKFGRLPLSFEANQGEAGAPVQFLAHGPGYSLYLTSNEATMVLSSGPGAEIKGQEFGAAGGLAQRPTCHPPSWACKCWAAGSGSRRSANSPSQAW